MKKKTMLKLADFMIDVAKYVLTVAIVMSFLTEFGETKFWYYAVGALFVAVCLIFGLVIINKTEDKS